MKILCFLIAFAAIATTTFAQKKPAVKHDRVAGTDSTNAAAPAVPATDSIYYIGSFSPDELNALVKFCLNDVDFLSDQGRRAWLEPFVKRFRAVPIKNPAAHLTPPASPPSQPPARPTPKDTTSKKP
jgi:hypothetical protein